MWLRCGLYGRWCKHGIEPKQISFIIIFVKIMLHFSRYIRQFFVAALLSLVFIGCAASTGGFRSLSVQETKTFLSNNPNVLVLDVRTAEEFSSPTGHLENATLIPVQELEQRIGELQQHKSKPIVVYCRTGGRSARASDLLTKQGFTAINMVGGIMDWNAANLPVVR